MRRCTGAAAVLVAMAVAGCGSPGAGTLASTTTAVAPAVTERSTVVVRPAPLPTDGAGAPIPQASPGSDGCEQVHPSTSVEGEGYETLHTVVAGDQPLTFDLAVRPDVICPGGDVIVDVGIHNAGTETIRDFSAPLSLVCDASIVKVLVGTLSATAIPPGDRAPRAGSPRRSPTAPRRCSSTAIRPVPPW